MIKKIQKKINEILIKTQRFTETDNVYLAKFGSYLALGNIISIAASFLLSIIFARYLSKETYGDYRYLLSIMTIIGIFALPGMEDALLQAVANKCEGCLRIALVKKFKWALLGSLTSLGVAVFFFFKDNTGLSISFIIAALFFPIMESLGIYLSYLGGKKLFGIQVKYSTITQVVAAIAIIITLLLKQNLIILVLVYFLSNTVLRGIFFFFTIKKFPTNQNYDEKFINFGKHLSFLRIIQTLAGQLDRMLLFNILGPVQLAIYSFAMLPTSEAEIFLKNIRLLALPKMAARSKKEIKKNLIRKIIKTTFLIIPLVVLYIILAPYLYSIFFPQYKDSVFFSQLLFLTIIAFPGSFIALTFQAQMAKKELYRFSIISPLILIILLIILTPLYGVIGAIIAQIISQFFTVIFALILFRKF